MSANKVSSNSVSLKGVGADQNLLGRINDFKAKPGQRLTHEVMGQSLMKQMLSPTQPKKKEK